MGINICNGRVGRYTIVLFMLLLAALVAAGCGGSAAKNVRSTQTGNDSASSPTVQATTVSKGEEATVGAEPLTTAGETSSSTETQNVTAGSGEKVADSGEESTGSGEIAKESQAASAKARSTDSGQKSVEFGESATESRSSSEKKDHADSGEKSAEPSASSQYGSSERQEGSRDSAPTFTAAPSMSGGSGSSANTIRAIRFGAHGGYERVVIDLGTGNSPASTVPEWSLESPTGDGRLKVNLPSVSSTAVSDGYFDGSLLESFYVVRSPEGGMFVDIFSGRAFYYRVIELSDPARLAIDFKPSGYDLGIPLPARGGNTVVTSPRRGETINSPLTVSGYSRNFEAQNTIILKNPDGRVVARKSVQSNDWASTWGYFDTTLEFPMFNGEGTLMVGTESARDGSFEGVEIPVKGGG